MTKEAHGLVAAPLCWFKKVCAVMESLGFRRILSDPCCWTLITDESDEEFIKRCGGKVEDYPEFTDPKAAAEYRKRQKAAKRWKVIAQVAAHVDDFMFAGRDWDPRWRVARQKIQDAFTWTPWESGTFLQCNVRLSQNVDYTTDMSMDHYVKDLEPIPLIPQIKGGE